MLWKTVLYSQVLSDNSTALLSVSYKCLRGMGPKLETLLTQHPLGTTSAPDDR